LHIVDGREVVALPVPDRARAVEVEDERDLLAGLQVARIVQEELPPGLRVRRIAEVRQGAVLQAGFAVAARGLRGRTDDAAEILRRRRRGDRGAHDADESQQGPVPMHAARSPQPGVEYWRESLPRYFNA